MPESTIALLSFVMTLMVFSYLLGDLPLVGQLYRIAVYIFVGMSAAFTLIVSYEGLILPYMQDMRDPNTSWTVLGSAADVYIFGAALLFGLLLLLKPLRRLTWLTNSVFAVVIVVSAAVAVLGALSGTLLPLLRATVTVPEAMLVDFTATLEHLLVFLGTVAGLFYFQYHMRVDEAGEAQPSRFGRGFRHVGKFFIVSALGALYAAAILTALTILTERVAFLFQYGGGA